MGSQLPFALVSGTILKLSPGCSTDDRPEDPFAVASLDPLIGTWKFSGAGAIGGLLKITLTFRSDGTFTFVEHVASYSYPAGYSPAPGCITAYTYSGTYAATVSGDTNRLRWTFVDGMANVVSGCQDPSLNSPGRPMTADEIDDLREAGRLPPTTGIYTVTSTELVFNPTVTTPFAGLRNRTRFTKSE